MHKMRDLLEDAAKENPCERWCPYAVGQVVVWQAAAEYARLIKGPNVAHPTQRNICL